MVYLFNSDIMNLFLSTIFFSSKISYVSAIFLVTLLLLSSYDFFFLTYDLEPSELLPLCPLSLFLPSIKVKSSNTAVNYEWTSNNKVIQQKSKEVELHYFKKGTYSISLTTTNQSGQSSTETKNITINSDYNLLAVDAFSPTENNSKINTFIPFALTERNTQFTMVILDAKNGGIIYQTNDANQPWDGIDIRTGNMVPQGENCLWKVTIYNPEPGENSIYKGIILRM